MVLQFFDFATVSVWLLAKPMHVVVLLFSTTTCGGGTDISDTLYSSVYHTLHSTLESGQEARIVQLDFSAAFDRVNHQRILFKLCSVDM